MNNKELYRIACSCANNSGYIDVVFESENMPLNQYDILEHRSSGAFVKCTSKNEPLWPITINDSFSSESLYIVEEEPVRNLNGKIAATLIDWSFSGPVIKGIEGEYQDVVVPNSIIEHLPKALSFDNVESLIKWLSKEFLFDIGNESMFFRIVGESEGMDGSWLGRSWLAKVVEKRIAQKDYLVIEKLQKSPQKALNIQRGCSKIRFIDEKNAVETNPIFKAQLALNSSDPNTIINLWKKYNNADEEIFKELQERSGSLRIKRIFKKNGKINAEIQNSPECIETFKNTYEAIKEDYPISINTPSIKGSLPLKNVSFDCKRQSLSWEWDFRLPHEKINDGEIKIDFKPWMVQIKRRKEALEAILCRNIPVQAITDILNKTTIPTFSTNITRYKIPDDSTLYKAFGDRKPNKAQLHAIKICLRTPDIALIQGPPGTGKTSVIHALQNYLQIVEPKRPNAIPSVLLTSFQHVAVDNVAKGSKIWGLPVFRFYGSKKDRESIFDGLRLWQKNTASVIDQQISSLQIDEKYAKYEKLMQKLYNLKNADFAYEIRSTLSDILDLSKKENFLSPDEAKDLSAFRPRFLATKKSNSLYTYLMGLRISPTSFKDDGSKNIDRLLSYYNQTKEVFDCPALNREHERLHKFIKAEPREEDFIWLHEFRNKCLEQILPNPIGKIDKTSLKMLQNYVKRLIPKIEERIKHSDIYMMQILKDYRESVESKSIRNAMLNYAFAFAATTQQSKSETFIKILGSKNFGFDYVIVDEAARANPLDLFIPMTLAKKKVILVGDHKQLPQLVDQNILEQMEEEPDKLHQLKQYMEESLFESLWNYLRSERNDGIERTVTLNIQYRMPKKLGDFVSASFYDSGTKIITEKNPEECKHLVSRYRKSNGECMCAAWEDVDGKESGQRSKKNEAEANRIVQLLREIVKETRETIGVIASYSEQVKLIEQLIKKIPALNDAIGNQQLDIGSIDAFQGKQFDIVFFSVVRNNDHSEFGFLTMTNRLNVAFSRQKKLLVVVGSQRMFRSVKAKEKVPALYSFIDLVNSET